MKKIALPDYISKLLERIWKESNPVSIFLYGSKARDDFENDSDYEVGVIYKKDKKWSRQQLKSLHNYADIKIYPFVEEELEEGVIDTPFPKTFYLLELINTSYVLYGKTPAEIIKRPKVTDNDMFEAIGFNLGRAYAAVVSSRQKDWLAVRDNLTKSLFHGLQILVFVKRRKFVFSYKHIVQESEGLVGTEYQDLIEHVVKVRKNTTNIEIPLLYKNVSFLNKIVLRSVKDIGMV